MFLTSVVVWVQFNLCINNDYFFNVSIFFREMKRRSNKEPWHMTRVNSPNTLSHVWIGIYLPPSLCLWSQCNILMYLIVKHHSLTHCCRIKAFYTTCHTAAWCRSCSLAHISDQYGLQQAGRAQLSVCWSQIGDWVQLGFSVGRSMLLRSSSELCTEWHH